MTAQPVARRGTRWLFGLACLAVAAAGLWALHALGIIGAAGADGGLSALREALARVADWQRREPVIVMLVYAAVYVAATAASLPGATVLTLAGGALFGFAPAVALVSAASTLGAVLAFWSARYLLRDLVRRRWPQRVAEVDARIERDGAWALLSLRLVPLVPFFLLNLAMGLTALRTGRYAVMSWLGMLPATVVYVNAGTALGSLRSLDDLRSPALWGAFMALAALPWGARGVGHVLERRRRLAPWAAQRPRRYDRDLIVIGAGSAGLVASAVAATLKARVTLVESDRMGGDCLNTGCVPSKALLHVARLAHRRGEAAQWGVPVADGPPDPAVWRARLRGAIAAIAPHDSAERYRALGVDVVAATAVLRTPWAVTLTAADGQVQELSARRILIATGAEPIVPDVLGLREAGALTSATLWSLDAPPPRLLVIGGGPLGCELAQAWARLGSQVTLVEQGPQLLPREDEDVGAAVAAALAADGVQVCCRHRVRAARREGGTTELAVQAGDDGPMHIRHAEAVLCAVGRAPRVQGLGLEALGLLDDTPQGPRLVTDDWLRTRLPHIYAAGDVAGPWQYTHAAGHQGATAAVNALLGPWRRGRGRRTVMPAVTYVDPEVARVGLNRRDAQALGVQVEVTRWPLPSLDRVLIEAGGGATADGWIELLTVPGRDRLLGVTIVGEQAGELIAEWALALQQGLGPGAVLATVHAYPTRADANRQAATAWRRARVPGRALRVLEAWFRWRRGGSG